MKRVSLTPYQEHKAKWKGCLRCHLHARRTTVVLARGKVPSDVVFIGEAPGHTEDGKGSAFVGRAGQRLDEIIDLALTDELEHLRISFTNLLACIPLIRGQTKVEVPDPDDVEACSPRLSEFIGIAKPQLIIRVGKSAKDALEPGLMKSPPFTSHIPMEDIVHPAWILRQNPLGQRRETNRVVVKLRDILEKHFA